LLCAAPTVLISLANAQQSSVVSRREESEFLPPARRRGFYNSAARRRARMDAYARLRINGNSAVYHCLRATAGTRVPSISERAAIKARQGVELITSGELRVVDEKGKDVPQDGLSRRDRRPRNVIMAGLLQRRESDRAGFVGRLVAHRRSRRSCIRTATSRFAIV